MLRTIIKGFSKLSHCRLFFPRWWLLPDEAAPGFSTPWRAPSAGRADTGKPNKQIQVATYRVRGVIFRKIVGFSG